jgi:hypothetical protein
LEAFAGVFVCAAGAAGLGAAGGGEGVENMRVNSPGPESAVGAGKLAGGGVRFENAPVASPPEGIGITGGGDDVLSAGAPDPKIRVNSP